LKVNADLKRELEGVVAKYGGKLEFFGHPTTTLEELFLRIVAESKAHPGRRFLPEKGVPVPVGAVEDPETRIQK